jgi:hypothetical protein
MDFDRTMDQRREPIDRSKTVDSSHHTALWDATGARSYNGLHAPARASNLGKRRSAKETFPLSQAMPTIRRAGGPQLLPKVIVLARNCRCARNSL